MGDCAYSTSFHSSWSSTFSNSPLPKIICSAKSALRPCPTECLRAPNDHYPSHYFPSGWLVAIKVIYTVRDKHVCLSSHLQFSVLKLFKTRPSLCHSECCPLQQNPGLVSLHGHFLTEGKKIQKGNKTNSQFQNKA